MKIFPELLYYIILSIFAFGQLTYINVVIYVLS